MNAPVYVGIDQGIHKVKLKVAQNEKRKKLRGFSFSINIANFEAFRRTKNLISNLFFLKSGFVKKWMEWNLPPKYLRQPKFGLIHVLVFPTYYACILDSKN